MKYKIIGPCAVHGNPPGKVVEATADWDVSFLLATGHIEPAEVPASTKSKPEPVETEN
jgi:hypothetical protein